MLSFNGKIIIENDIYNLEQKVYSLNIIIRYKDMAEEKKQAVESSKKQINLDYFGNLKKAFDMVRHHRYLWYLGILAGGSFTSFNYSGGNFNNLFQQKNGSTASAASSNVNFNGNQIWSEIVKWINENWLIVVVAAVIVLILIIIFTILSNMAKAGLVHSIDKLSKKEESSFGQAMRFGWYKFWRVFGTGLLIGLALVAVITALALPAIVLWFVKPLLILYILLFIFAVIFVSLIAGITFEYSLRYIVLKDEKIVNSIKNGYGLLKDIKKESAILWLVTIGTTMVCGLVLVMAMILVLLVLFLLGLLLFILTPVLGIVYAVIVGIAFIVATLIAGGFISSLVSAYWTLSFKELTA